MQGEEIRAAQAAFSLPDPRELNPLQLAYVGDTMHDLYVRSLLVSRKMSVGSMHKQAVRMVSAAAQAAMRQHCLQGIYSACMRAMQSGENGR